jgi:hypothetical protein
MVHRLRLLRSHESRTGSFLSESFASFRTIPRSTKAALWLASDRRWAMRAYRAASAQPQAHEPQQHVITIRVAHKGGLL